MKSSLMALILTPAFILGTGCSSDDGIESTLTPTLEQSEIKLKIAQYYSSPSTSTQPVAKIKTEFDKKFPQATDVEWKVSNNVYEIDFDVNHVDYEAWYDNNANLLMYKHDIAHNELPAAVSSALANDYQGYILDEVEKVYKGNVVGYYLDLEKNNTEIHAFYNGDGTFISKNLWENDAVKPANDVGTTTPDIGGTLSDEQVDALIVAYYSTNDIDVAATNVLVAIVSNFNVTFQNARDIDWETAAEVYKVDFEINNVDYDAWYNKEGVLLAYKFDITRASLPQNVQTAIETRFGGYRVEDAEKVIKINSSGYWVELEKGNVEEKAYFGEDGSYISNLFYKKSNGTPEEPVTPEMPMNGDYTDTEIDALLLAYQQGRDTDILSKNVPSPVITAFNTQFVSAHDTEWDYVGNVYNVDFEIANVDYEAWYANNGALLMYTRQVGHSTVATAVKDEVSNIYANYMIEDCHFFQKGTVKGYILELENKSTDAELVVAYNEDGTFLYQKYD
ncbi:MAG: PepSY-like domain-containing protein [Paludibacteraceae bacterium]